MKVYAIGGYPPSINRKKMPHQTMQNAASYSFVPEKINYAPIYASNIVFKGFNCSPDNFDVKRAYGIECPCCGQVMPTKKQVTSFVNRTGDKKGSELQKELKKGMDFFRPNELEIVNILLDTSEEFPDLDLNGLVAYNSKCGIQELQEMQSEILDEMRDEAENLDEETRTKVFEELEQTKEDIYSDDEDNHFKRKDFTERMNQIAENSSDENRSCMNRLLELAEDMPTSNTNKDAFFVKYSRRSNREIATRLMLPAMVTTEHIRPKSKNGQNNTDNYIPLCGTCNSARGNTPYNEWFEDHPEMRTNLQNYIDKISRMIENGEFQRYEYYRTYVDEVIQAIEEATDGELILSKPVPEEEQPNETEPEEAPEEEETPDKMRERLMAQYNKGQKELSALLSRKSELDKDEEFQNIKIYKQLSSEIRAIKPLRDKKRSEYLATKGKLRSREEALSKAREENNTEEIGALEVKCKELTTLSIELKKEYIQLETQYGLLNFRFENIKSKVTTPDELSTEIASIKRRLQELSKAQAEYENLLKISTSEDEELLIIEAANLNIRIQSTEDSSEKEQLVQRKRIIEKKVDAINAARKKLRSAKSKCRRLKESITDSKLESRLNALIKRKAELNSKFHDIDIEQRIAKKQAECDEILQRYVESFEEEFYQHSYPSIEGESSSSSS